MTSVPDHPNPSRDTDSVVVIGAGPAGLTAAHELSKRGARCTILESDDVVGGSSRTVERDGWRFDIGGHRFFFYANEGAEPPHVHIRSAEKSAKFWLDPVSLARSSGYDAVELRALRGYVQAHRESLERAWHDFHNR